MKFRIEIKSISVKIKVWKNFEGIKKDERFYLEFKLNVSLNIIV